jgi:DNA polymerase-3 subunit chi
MSRVDFYVLPENSNMDRFACTMIGKAWSKGNQVYVHTASMAEAAQIDDLLWIFRDISFIPHTVIEGDGQVESPVIIGCQDTSPEGKQVMVNLTSAVPSFALDFTRVIEFVAGDQTRRQQARVRYRHYRDLGCDIKNHSIETTHELT